MTTVFPEVYAPLPYSLISQIQLALLMLLSIEQVRTSSSRELGSDDSK